MFKTRLVMKKWFCVLGLFFNTACMAAPIHIVAAENFYASIAKEIGGAYVVVESIMNQPNQDPHLFNVTPRTVERLTHADLIVFNGLGYDSWMQRLLTALPTAGQAKICVATLINKKAGDNPHIWYDPATMPTYAKTLLYFLIQKDPAHRLLYQSNYQAFSKSYQSLYDVIERLKLFSQGVKVIATEPVFAYMATRLGFDMQGIAFQMSMMNGVDPSPQQVIAFRKSLQSRSVKLVLYNKQVSSPLVRQLLTVATSNAIPIVGITETQPISTPYTAWMLNQLKEVAQALHAHASI